MDYGRLPWLAPGDLDEAQRRLYDTIVGGPRASGARAYPLTDEEGRLHGAFNALLLDPVVGEGVQHLGSVTRTIWTRFGDARAREIAILVVAAAARSEIEWHSHVNLGRAAGLTDDEISAIRDDELCATFNADEQLMWRVARSLVRERDLDDELFAAGAARFGHVLLMDLVVLTGYYELLARHLRVWRTPLAEGTEAQFS